MLVMFFRMDPIHQQKEGSLSRAMRQEQCKVCLKEGHLRWVKERFPEKGRRGESQRGQGRSGHESLLCHTGEPATKG